MNKIEANKTWNKVFRILDYFTIYHTGICDFRLRLKQNRYPVLLLTQADTKIYPHYADVRTQSVMMAAEFAQAHDLLVSNLPG